MLVFKNATLYNFTPEHIAKLMRCNLPTAKRLFLMAKKSGWFVYNRRHNSLRALSMKSRRERISKNGWSYRSDFCYCMDKEFVSLSEMVKRLRGVIILMIIVRAAYKRPYQNGANKETADFTMVYQETFALKLGLSNSAVCKLLKHLTEIGMLSKTKQFFSWIFCNPNLEDVEEFERTRHCKLIRRISSRYYCRAKYTSYNYYRPFGLGYSVSEKNTARFRHIIWTHINRVAA